MDASPIADVLEKRELVSMLQRREQLRQSMGLAFYKPHAKQDAFHRAGAFRRRYARTGNRWGKTTAGTAEDCAWAMGERMWYPKEDNARTVGIPKRSTKGCIIVQDWDKAEEIFTSIAHGESRGMIFKLLPEAAISSIDKNRQGLIYRVLVKSIWGGVSSIHIDTIKSFMQDPMGHESSRWDWIHIDEPCPQEMWTAYARGLVDKGGSAWFMCTPLTQMWINDMFIPRAQTRAEFNEPGMAGKKWWITGSIFDNPNLDKNDIQDFIADVPLGERETRIDGRPRALSGVIYREFDPSIHVYDPGDPCLVGWENDFTPPANYLIKYAIDPHPQTPHAVLFMAISPGGYIYLYQEIFHHCLIRDLCELIVNVPGAYTAFKVLCDLIAFNPSVTGDGTQMVDDFRENGIYPEGASKDLSRGILAVQAVLAKKDYKGQPIVHVSRACHETLFEFDRYVWDKKKAVPDPKCPDHMMENLYRLVLDGLQWHDPIIKSYPTIPALSISHTMLDLPKVGGDDDIVNKILKQSDLRYANHSSTPTCPWDPTDYHQ